MQNNISLILLISACKYYRELGLLDLKVPMRSALQSLDYNVATNSSFNICPKILYSSLHHSKSNAVSLKLWKK
jgi:hypothetical protein